MDWFERLTGFRESPFSEIDATARQRRDVRNCEGRKSHAGRNPEMVALAKRLHPHAFLYPGRGGAFCRMCRFCVAEQPLIGYRLLALLIWNKGGPRRFCLPWPGPSIPICRGGSSPTLPPGPRLQTKAPVSNAGLSLGYWTRLCMDRLICDEQLYDLTIGIGGSLGVQLSSTEANRISATAVAPIRRTEMD